jgi:ABC-type nitrate/sulfonate/bicarbonate transport system substrate-binding protein
LKKIFTLAIGLWLLIALAACTPIAPAAEQVATEQLTPVDLCLSSVSMSSVLATYAVEHGIFEKYGLDIELYNIEGGAEATVALIAGDADICHIAGPPVVNAALAGEDLVFVAGIGNQQNYYMLVTPEIESAADLKGKVMAVSSLGSGSDTILRQMLGFLGLQPDVDVTIVAVGGNPERLAALESGQVAGTVMSLPTSARAESMGYHVLVSPGDMDVDYQHTAVETTRDFLASNRPLVVSYLKALTEAIAQIRADPEGAKAAMVEMFGLDPVADAGVIDRTYQQYFHEYLPTKIYPTEAGVQALIDEARLENPTARDLTAADIIDDSIVQELDESGFIDSVMTGSQEKP